MISGITRLLTLAALLTVCFGTLTGGVRPDNVAQIRMAGEIVMITRNSPTTYYEDRTGPTGYEYELVFEGLNEANGGQAQPVVLYRCKFSPTSGLDLITEEFANLSLSGEVLVDTTKTGVGISRYGKIWNPQ